MSLKLHNPPTVPAPLGSYSHGVEVPPNSRLLYVSGQTAVDANGDIPDGIEAQAELVWSRIAAVLAAAHMGIPHICKMTAYLTNSANAAGYARVRAKYLGEHRPAAVGIIVPALFNPKYLVEVEVIAAAAA
jgi:2-iminobutanoate/2-iminopropanoate deaminase